MWHSDILASGSRRRQILCMSTQCWNTEECGRTCVRKEPIGPSTCNRGRERRIFFFSESVLENLNTFQLSQQEHALCVYNHCIKHAREALPSSNIQHKSSLVTDWSETPSQHCFCHKLGRRKHMVAHSRGNTNSCTFLEETKTKKIKQEVGLPGTKLLGLSNKINNQDQP